MQPEPHLQTAPQLCAVHLLLQTEAVPPLQGNFCDIDSRPGMLQPCVWHHGSTLEPSACAQTTKWIALQQPTSLLKVLCLCLTTMQRRYISVNAEHERLA